MDLGGKQLTQLTNHFAIDTEPTWAPDGSAVYFTSDRGGRPQVYKVGAGGGSAERVTFRAATTPSPRCPTMARRSPSPRARATATRSR